MKGISIAIIVTCFVLISGCSKGSGTGTGSGTGGGGGTTPFVPNCTGASTSFNADVLPIFTSVCAQASCHNSGSINGPGALTTYAQINAAKGLIRPAIISAAMPKTGTLNSSQKNSIICWIDNGAPNN